MRRITVLLFLIALSCRQESKVPAEVFPVLEGINRGWIVYEGRIPLDEETNLHLEVSMLTSELIGEGSFILTEFVDGVGGIQNLPVLKGKYSTVYGANQEGLIVQFHNSARAVGVTRTFIIETGYKSPVTNSSVKRLRKQKFRNTDLVLRTDGKSKLIVLDQELRPVTTESNYNLFKRASGLFTVEGYFRHRGDTADFYEMNTKENWAVAKLGEYDIASNHYHKLVKEKLEVTYLKAIGYSVEHSDKNGDYTQAIVFKKILQMASAPSFFTKDLSAPGENK